MELCLHIFEDKIKGTVFLQNSVEILLNVQGATENLKRKTDLLFNIKITELMSIISVRKMN